MQSPYEKNLYLFLIASAYALKIKSFPANALTSINNVDFGKWKLVIKLSITLNSYGG